MGISFDKLIEREQREFYTEHMLPLERAIKSCESPIETLLLWSMVNNCYGWNSLGYTSAVEMPSHWLPGGSLSRGSWTVCLGNDLCFWPQLEIDAGGRLYRLDIGVEMRSQWGDKARTVYLDVECDGFDFHERTKEQASRDKTRDQDLQAVGWYVCRFTGSDIYRDPVDCTTRALGMAQNILSRMWKSEG